MTEAILLQLLPGLLIGGSLGVAMGYLGQCNTGACPITVNPWRGAFLGAMIGGLFAWFSGPSLVTADIEPGVLQIDSAKTFERRVLGADKPVLVDFYSDSCPPCRELAPTIEQLAKQYRGRAVISKVNVNELPELTTRYGIYGVPTVLLFRNGQEVRRLEGLRPQRAYTAVLDSL